MKFKFLLQVRPYLIVCLIVLACVASPLAWFWSAKWHQSLSGRLDENIIVHCIAWLGPVVYLLAFLCFVGEFVLPTKGACAKNFAPLMGVGLLLLLWIPPIFRVLIHVGWFIPMKPVLHPVYTGFCQLVLLVSLVVVGRRYGFGLTRDP